MAKLHPPVAYSDYLKIPELLSLQKRKSEEYGRPAHDETLFIVVHQTYELWFKQILTELNSAIDVFGREKIDESAMGVAVARLQRIVAIQRLLIDQVSVLETMTPLDFLEFRDMLYPASGFQSAQFREIENKLGLRSSARLDYNDANYVTSIAAAERDKVMKAETDPSLYDLLEKWLERTPFLETSAFKFWAEYCKAVKSLFERDKATVASHPGLDDAAKKRNLDEIDKAQSGFEAFFDKNLFEAARQQGLWRLSYPAIHACLLIQLYRDQPILHLPHLLLSALQDIDENFTQWRYRHALMAHRMLGAKIGTGGSSGAAYLRSATDKHRIYSDLFNLATYLIPRSELPELPADARRQLGFFYGADTSVRA